MRRAWNRYGVHWRLSPRLGRISTLEVCFDGEIRCFVTTFARYGLRAPWIQRLKLDWHVKIIVGFEVRSTSITVIALVGPVPFIRVRHHI